MTDHVKNEDFQNFKDNHFAHLVVDVAKLTVKVANNTKLLWWIMGLVAATFIATVASLVA